MNRLRDLIATYRAELEEGSDLPGAAVQSDPPDNPELDSVPEEQSLWDSLMSETDDDFAEEPEALDSEDSSDAEETPEPVEEPAQEEPTPDEPEPQPEPEPEPTPEPAPQPQPEPTPEPPQLTPEQQQQQRAEYLAKLEAHFQISEDEALQLVTDPQKALPKLHAKLYAQMYEAVMQTMRQHLPSAVEHTIEASRMRNEQVDTFFSRWPKLNRAAHGADIARVAQMYGQLHPNATGEQVIRDVGMQVMFMHGLTPDDVVQPQQSVTPSAPPVPPAVNGGRASSPQQSNIWESMADELLEDDLY